MYGERTCWLLVCVHASCSWLLVCGHHWPSRFTPAEGAGAGWCRIDCAASRTVPGYGALPPADFAAQATEVDIEDCWKVHARAVERGETSYTDPETGYFVFTAIAHTNRGRCCGSGCRHCPYNHVHGAG